MLASQLTSLRLDLSRCPGNETLQSRLAATAFPRLRTLYYNVPAGRLSAELLQNFPELTELSTPLVHAVSNLVPIPRPLLTSLTALTQALDHATPIASERGHKELVTLILSVASIAS